MGTCETCRFWATTDNSLGDCRRYAPRPVAVEGGFYANGVDVVWAYTEPFHWCGEHQAKERDA